MEEPINGVVLEKHEDWAICYIKSLSNELKKLIRKNLATICHGSHISEYGDQPLFGYEATLSSFLGRYEGKSEETKIGMVGEFLAHILITELFDEFHIATAFFNLEEKSIRKGFDLVLYRANDKSIWITEVKSGSQLKGKSHDETTRALLNRARADVHSRLNKQETMYWYNAVNSVRASVSNTKSYKESLVHILNQKGSAAVKHEAKSIESSVMLISALFEPLKPRVSTSTPRVFLESLQKKKQFNSVVVLCIQKETYTRIMGFLASEIEEAAA